MQNILPPFQRDTDILHYLSWRFKLSTSQFMFYQNFQEIRKNERTLRRCENDNAINFK